MWYFQEKQFTEEMIGGAVGFVYEIKCLKNNRSYIGKKLFTKSKVLKPLKGKKRKRRSRISSDWQDYWGSSKELQEDKERLGPEAFHRIIHKLCYSKSECSYEELKMQLMTDCLLKPEEYYNSYVGTRIHRSHLLPKTS